MTEEYLKKRHELAKKKMIATICLLVCPVLLVVFMELIVILLDHQVGAIVFGLRYFIFVFLEGIVIYKLVRYVRMVKDNEYLKSVEIHRQDERNQSINLRASSITIKTAFYLFFFLLIISGFIDIIVFYTLLSSFVLIVIIYIIIKNIYIRKL